jgi:hypothetical protein
MTEDQAGQANETAQLDERRRREQDRADFLRLRNRAHAAVGGWTTLELQRSQAERDKAMETARQNHEKRLEAERSVVRLASGLAATASYAQSMTSQLTATAGANPATADWQTFTYPCPEPVEGLGPVRLGVLAQPLLPSEWTGSFLSEGDAVPVLVPLNSLHLVIDGRTPDRGADLLRSVVLRLVMGNEIGQVRLTLIDPRGSGQGLALFRELPAALRGDRVLTVREEIEDRLATIGRDIEEVLQARLGARHATLDDYNAANPEVAQPHQVIAIADLPAGGWTARGLELLGRVALNGPRAGVHIVASLDRSAPTPSGFDTDTMVSPATVTLIDADDRARINDRELGEIMFIPDGLPEVGKVSDWLAEAGRAFATRSRVLSADRVLPALDWAGSSGDGVEVPIGLNEEGELLALRVSDDPVRGPAHGLVGGMTGMGKSNLLNLLIAGISSRYSPDEVGLYLLDFKQGVGFAPYRSLPHARAVALETEREFALSVLLDLQEEMGRRGPLFTAAGVQKFADYRGRGRPLQRLILLIDEFQVLVGADDTVGRDAAAVLETLVKQGRGFGIHVLLSSQSPAVAGQYLSRIYNQMGLRIALKCMEADAFAILGPGNKAPTELGEPGEAVVNEGLGRPEDNRRVRVALLGDEDLADRVAAIGVRDAGRHPAPVTFEGAAPAGLEGNPRLRELLCGEWQPASGSAEVFLGEPVQIKGPTSAAFERYPRANLLIAGPDEAAAYGLLVSSIVSLALEQPNAHFDVIDFARPSSAGAGILSDLAKRIAGRVAFAGPREASGALTGLALALAARLESPGGTEDPRYFVLAGLHRWRELRGATQFDTTAEATTLLRLLDEGPDVGIHVIAWTDGVGSLDRALRRGAAGQFDLRAVLRVPENDAQNLLESPAAARLADNRALFRNEEWPAGRVEKFKPYGLPSSNVLDALLGQPGKEGNDGLSAN